MNLYPPIYKVYDNIAKRDHDITSLEHLITSKTQGFGENPQIYGPKFGLKGHNGVDWGVKEGTPIYASHDGRVTQVSLDENAGLGVVIQAPEGKTIYWHMSKVIAPQGILVQRGDLIGLSGNTGFSTGAHLHFGFKPSTGGIENLRNNGYDGAVDPIPFMAWATIGDNHIHMTEQEVVKSYVLIYGKNPDAGELGFWRGKALSDFLDTALKNLGILIDTTTK